MPSLPSERALRRLVVEISMAATDDIRAILEGLEPAQRARVERMLANLAGQPDAQAARVPTSILPDGLSPGLIRRLEGNATGHDQIIRGHDGKAFAMTTLALTTLQSCAAEMVSHQVPTVQRPTLFAKLLGLVPGLRATT